MNEYYRDSTVNHFLFLSSSLIFASFFSPFFLSASELEKNHLIKIVYRVPRDNEAVCIIARILFFLNHEFCGYRK